MIGADAHLIGLKTQAQRAYAALRGPALAVAYDERSLRSALGKHESSSLDHFTILVLGSFPLTSGITVNKDGLTIMGLGLARLVTAASGAAITVAANDLTLRDLRITGSATTAISVTAAANRLRTMNVISAAATYLDVASGVTLNNSIIMGNDNGGSGGNVTLRGSYNRISGIRADTVTIASGADNVLYGNLILTSATDSASSGNNSATGNAGGASYAGWTGTGSVAAGNT